MTTLKDYNLSYFEQNCQTKIATKLKKSCCENNKKKKSPCE